MSSGALNSGVAVFRDAKEAEDWKRAITLAREALRVARLEKEIVLAADLRADIIEMKAALRRSVK